MLNEHIIYLILLFMNIIYLIIGYILGRLSKLSGVSHNIVETPKSFFKQQKEEQVSKVSIDSTKIVTNINTSGLERKYTDLGQKQESKEDISSSINKLKNMKG